MKYYKIMTQNLYLSLKNKNKRVKEIKRHIEKNNYDVVFLQETLFYTDLFKLQSNHNLVYKKGLFGPRGGLITIMKQIPDEVKFHKFKEQGKLYSLQIADRFLGKGFLVAKKGDVSYINTHLIAIYSKHPKRRKQEQQKVSNQFEELFEFLVKELKNRQVVIGGDFNFNQKTKDYLRLTKSVLVDNTASLEGKLDYDEKEGQLDFIFSNNGLTFNEQIIDYPILVSDHKGISLELMLL